jgi:hypothetical protein
VLLLDTNEQLFTGTHESIEKPELLFADTFEVVPNQTSAVEFEGGAAWPPPMINGVCTFRCRVLALSRDCGSRKFVLQVGTANHTVEAVRTTPFSCVNYSLTLAQTDNAPGWNTGSPLTWYNQMVSFFFVSVAPFSPLITS